MRVIRHYNSYYTSPQHPTNPHHHHTTTTPPPPPHHHHTTPPQPTTGVDVGAYARIIQDWQIQGDVHYDWKKEETMKEACVNVESISYGAEPNRNNTLDNQWFQSSKKTPAIISGQLRKLCLLEQIADISPDVQKGLCLATMDFCEGRLEKEGIKCDEDAIEDRPLPTAAPVSNGANMLLINLLKYFTNVTAREYCTECKRVNREWDYMATSMKVSLKMFCKQNII